MVRLQLMGPVALALSFVLLCLNFRAVRPVPMVWPSGDRSPKSVVDASAMIQE